MQRDLSYGIPFGVNEQFRLIREMVLVEGQDIGEEYIVAGNGQDVHFSPSELAELLAAIHEMLRMEEQHCDALQDGWVVGAVLAATATNAEQPDPAPDEAAIKKPLSDTALFILRGMRGGRRVFDAAESGGVAYEVSGTRFAREPWEELQDRRLVCVAVPDDESYYTISAEGVDFLAAQEPDDD